MIKKISKEHLFIFIIYMISFSFMLLNKGINNDDPYLVHQSLEVFRNFVLEIGVLSVAWLYYFVSFFAEFFIYRFISFLSYLIAVFLLYSILQRIKEIDKFSRFLLVLFFAIAPLNIHRISICAMGYAVHYCLFFLAFWLFCVFLEKRYFYLRILSIVLFFVSFFVNSLLVFYLVPMLYLIYFYRDKIKNVFDLLKNLLRYWDFLILPLLFFALRHLFFSPVINYNKMEIKNILPALYNTLEIYYESFFVPLKIACTWQLAFPYILFGIIGGAVLFILLKKKGKEYLYDKKYFFFLFGIFLFFIAAYPYVFIGKRPVYYSYQSRHQLLLPLGFSFMIVYGIRIVCSFFKSNKGLMSTILCCFFIMAFMTFNLVTYAKFQTMYYKQLSIIEHIKESDIIKNNQVAFTDSSTYLNGHYVSLTDREMSYLFYEAYGLKDKEIRKKLIFDRFAVEPKKEYNNLDEIDFFRNQDKKLADYEVLIESKYNANFVNLLKLLYYEYFNKEKFIKEIRTVVYFKYIKKK